MDDDPQLSLLLDTWDAVYVAEVEGSSAWRNAQRLAGLTLYGIALAYAEHHIRHET